MKNVLDDLKRNHKLEGFYRGIVEDRIDPEKLGRCRIRVYGVHTSSKEKNNALEGVPTEHLPWAEPAISAIEGGVSGFGLWSVPLQGAQVRVWFEEGNIMYPRYDASLPGRPVVSSKGLSSQGFNDPNEKYPIDKKNIPHEPVQIGENDMHKLATTEKTTDTIVKSKNDNKIQGVITATGVQWDEPDSYYNPVYPDNIVLATHSGITIEVDNSSDHERIHIYHPSNSYIEIGPDGSIVIRNKNNKFELVDNNKKVRIGGNLDQTIDKNNTNYVKQNKTEKIDINKDEIIGQNKSETVGGNKRVQINGAEDKDVSSTYNLNASIINLNC